MAYVYHECLDASAPFAPQPAKIKTTLKPHQLAALQKATVMERTCELKCYESSQEEGGGVPTVITVRANMGLIGDIVGYGKTLTALALIAAVPNNAIYNEVKHISSSYSSSSFHVVEKEWNRGNIINDLIPSTLVVVPRGPVFCQWESTIAKQTTLKALIIDRAPTINKLRVPSDATPAELKAFFGGYDIVLVKDTMIKKLLAHFHERTMQGWNRVMVDEAHDTLWTTPNMSFRFLWMITASYNYMLNRGVQRSQLAYNVRYLSNDIMFQYLLIRGDLNFVQESFSVPAYVEQYYTARMPTSYRAVMPFLSQEVRDQLNANDIAGAIQTMGGNSQTETNLVKLVTIEVEREIANKHKEIEYVTAIDMPADLKAARLKVLDASMARLLERQQAIIERVTSLADKCCAICYDNYTHPTMLECTHVFCGQCIMDWVVAKKQFVCPQCRASVSEKFVHIIAPSSDGSNSILIDSNGSSGSGAAGAVPVPMNKVDILMKIITERPTGKFLIFSSNEASFYTIKAELESHQIINVEMKGSTAVMMHNLEKFRNGVARVVLLNTRFAGSGIDISCATDVIIFHKMDDYKMQAVGRAQRVGRTSTLAVHNICYPDEMPSATVVPP